VRRYGISLIPNIFWPPPTGSLIFLKQVWPVIKKRMVLRRDFVAHDDGEDRLDQVGVLALASIIELAAFPAMPATRSLM
jgi:hypothetical protein